MLKDEVSAEPVSRHHSGHQQDVEQVQPPGGLAGVFEQLRQKGTEQRRAGGDQVNHQNEEYYLNEYLNSKLETVACLKYWENQEKEAGSNKIKKALSRLARYAPVLE